MVNLDEDFRRGKGLWGESRHNNRDRDAIGMNTAL
jgi:hypothetical protein